MPDMVNMRIAPYNFHDTATLASDPVSETNFPPENTQNRNRDSRYRSTGLDDQVLKGTWNGDGRTVNMFAFFLQNAHAGTVQLQIYSDDDWTTEIYDSGVISADTFDAFSPLGGFDWGFDPLGGDVSDPLAFESPFILYFENQEALSYKITWSGFASGLGCLEVGRIFLGKYFEVGINPSYGLNLSLGDNSVVSRTHGGTARTSKGARWRKLDLDLSYMSEEDRPFWVDVMGKLLTDGDFVIDIFPGVGGRTQRDHFMNGRFSSLDAIYIQQSYRTKKIKVEEV